MGLRTGLLAALIRDVLGPRDGPHEVLETSPLNEYLTGVLQPADVITPGPAPEPEALEEIPEIPETGEENTDDLEIPPPVFSPALDPKNRPASMGLSFCIRVDSDATDPHLEICVTWARYILDSGTKNGSVIHDGSLMMFPSLTIPPLFPSFRRTIRKYLCMYSLTR